MQDWHLLQEFAKNNSQEAFGHLVERHLNLVYSTCLREIGDHGLAEDATQVVFLLLSQKAGTLRPGTILTGWLFQTARFVARNTRKQDVRWRQRTQKVAEAMIHEAQTSSPVEDETWSQIEPLFHDAMNTLKTGERDAVLLWCFEGRSLRETGEVLGVTEDAARKRVARALDKLRHYFKRNGVTLSVATLSVLLSGHALQAAPVGLATTLGTVFFNSALATTANSMAASGFSTKVLAMAEGTKRAWLLGNIKIASTAVCGALLLGVVTERLLHRMPPPSPPRVALTPLALTPPVGNLSIHRQPRLEAKPQKLNRTVSKQPKGMLRTEAKSPDVQATVPAVKRRSVPRQQQPRLPPIVAKSSP